MERPLALETKNLSVGYRGTPVEKCILGQLNLKAPYGRLIALLGANGTGKSTLLRTLAGLQRKLQGDVWLDGKNLTELTPRETASKLSIVLTDKIQAGYLSVGDLVGMGRYPYTNWQGQMQTSDLEATLDALNVTGLAALKHTFLNELSDGQIQKAMIARALAQDGNIMLLDEPLVHLDIPSKWEIMGILKKMSVERKKTIILASHELELSLQMADLVWLVNQPGRLVSGTPAQMVDQGIISKAFDTDYYKFESSRFKKT